MTSPAAAAHQRRAAGRVVLTAVGSCKADSRPPVMVTHTSVLEVKGSPTLKETLFKGFMASPTRRLGVRVRG